MIIRVFSRQGLRDLAENLKEVLFDKSTRPAELLLALIVLGQGVFWLLSAHYFEHNAAFSSLARYVGQDKAGWISVVISSSLIYSLIGYKRDHQQYEKLSRVVSDKVDNYYGDNKVFTDIRRNCLIFMASWCFFLTLMFVTANAVNTGTITYSVFFLQMLLSLRRLRLDGAAVRRALVRRRATMDREFTTEALRAAFAEHVFDKGPDDTLGRRSTDTMGPVGGSSSRYLS